jgi:hypothetical protein
MLEDLKSRILSWSPEQANLFHDNIKRYGNDANRIWETTDDGFYIMSADRTVFYNNTGTSYHLEFGNLTDHLSLVNNLSLLSKEKNLIEIKLPINILTVTIENILYTYWEEVSPYPNHGFDFTNLLLVDKSQQSEVVIKFLKNLLVAVDQIILLIDELYKDGNSYPLEIQTNNFYYDPITQKHFWGTNFALQANRDQSVSVALHAVNGLDNYIQSYLNLVIPNFTEDLKTFLRDKCITLQPAI